MPFDTIEIQDKSGFQSVEIPDDFKINDNKVYLKKVGNALYLIPFHNPWQSLYDSVNEFTEDFMNERKQPGLQIRESLD